MFKKIAHNLETLFTAIGVELPLAIGKWSITAEAGSEIEAAVWRAYDAWIQLADHSFEALYDNHYVGELFGAAAPLAIRWQHMSGLMMQTWQTAFNAAMSFQAPLLPSKKPLQTVSRLSETRPHPARLAA